ncbi:response regulator transcription factor [Merismopedia glauca]|uniref:DNA-binding response regulator n=1 Tax=Merismopedia glauca CCAP 1448/3 TaxID=1296344 RepID=A0A2T1C0P4_9CYAN|nr:response regulator transcription factor [Merismopedia glauca]PSB01737.1 DNA-binding response regulator [Merismopedia glauca CCAP 1448/3]
MSLLILVADDNLGTRMSISEYLEFSGYSVISVEDGQQAFYAVEKYHPHVLITDISMPLMDGYELVQRLRQEPVYRLLPIIFLTERSSMEERIRGYQLGCDFYLPKPFGLNELGAMIRNLLERTQLIESAWRSRLQPMIESSNESDRDKIGKYLPSSPKNSINLTEREQEVLKLVTKGLSNTEIGSQLYLSPRTVEKHVSSLLRKIEGNNRAELVRFALENRIID